MLPETCVRRANKTLALAVLARSVSMPKLIRVGYLGEHYEVG